MHVFLSESKLKSNISNGAHKSVSLITVNSTVEKEIYNRYITNTAIANWIQWVLKTSFGFIFP